MLGGHCHSGSLCNFVESFKHTQQMRHKTPRHPLVDKQVLSKNHWYCLVIPNITFPGKIRFWVNKNILTQISVTSNHMSLQKTFCVKFGQQVCKSAMEDLIRNKQPVKQLLQRRPIFIDHLPKFNTKNSVWSQFILNGTSGLMRAKLFFHIFLLRLLYQGSHLLQILFKVLYTVSPHIFVSF